MSTTTTIRTVVTQIVVTRLALSLLQHNRNIFLEEDPLRTFLHLLTRQIGLEAENEVGIVLGIENENAIVR
jgi:hypothetical protein